jgi:hypothetical protein
MTTKDRAPLAAPTLLAAQIICSTTTSPAPTPHSRIGGSAANVTGFTSMATQTRAYAPLVAVTRPPDGTSYYRMHRSRVTRRSIDRIGLATALTLHLSTGFELRRRNHRPVASEPGFGHDAFISSQLLLRRQEQPSRGYWPHAEFVLPQRPVQSYLAERPW